MKSLLNIFFLVFLAKGVMGQLGFQYNYFPNDLAGKDEWKVQVAPFFNQQAGSNTFTNNFFSQINKSQFIDDELIEKQRENMSGTSLSGQITSMGLGVKFNLKKKPGQNYLIFVLENQHFLDASLDDDLINLLLKGNKSFAGQTLIMKNSSYYNVYFNQIKGGMGHRFESGNSIHKLSWLLGFNIGQNYNDINLKNSSFYTQPDGDYLDIETSIMTELSDTVWGKIFEVNGYGVSADLEYHFTKSESFHVGFSLKNLGLIFWNGNTFTGEMDTSFIFNGISNDSLTGQNENLPNDFSYNNLRRILFKNSNTESFSKGLPVSLKLTLGKYLSGEKFYLGIQGIYYPLLEANYEVEAFATWNYKNSFYLTPIVVYGSFGNVNFGLGFGVKILNSIYLYAGSKYLNSMFDKNATLGSGGFARVIFIL